VSLRTNSHVGPLLTKDILGRSYRLAELERFFNARRASHRTDPKLFDEVIYTPYSFNGPRPSPNPRSEGVGDLLGIPELEISEATGDVPKWNLKPGQTHDTAEPSLHPESSHDIMHESRPRRTRRRVKFDKVGQDHLDAEVFLFEYGTVVCWGMTEVQERRFLSSMCSTFLSHILISS
jgi:uncharacterized Rmd1/YagE family protein